MEGYKNCRHLSYLMGYYLVLNGELFMNSLRTGFWNLRFVFAICYWTRYGFLDFQDCSVFSFVELHIFFLFTFSFHLFVILEFIEPVLIHINLHFILYFWEFFHFLLSLILLKCFEKHRSYSHLFSLLLLYLEQILLLQKMFTTILLLAVPYIPHLYPINLHFRLNYFLAISRIQQKKR